MIRAVLDANVFVTAILTPAGPAAAVLDAWRQERFELLVSQPILDELARVLAYPKIARRHGWSRKEIREIVAELGDLAILTPGRVELSVIREDPDDDRYLECAVEGRAGYIVTGAGASWRWAPIATSKSCRPVRFWPPCQQRAASRPLALRPPGVGSRAGAVPDRARFQPPPHRTARTDSPYAALLSASREST